MDSEKVITAILHIARKKPAEIQGHLSLGTLGLSSSFGLSALRSILEKESKAKISPLSANMKVDDVLALMSGKPMTFKVPSPPPVKQAARLPASAPHTPAPLGLGLDMQEIGTMPKADNFRTHDFYTSHFNGREIATAMLKPDPRAHLCGIFCAKEAAKKSHPNLLNLRMGDFVVAHDAAGRPLLSLTEGLLPGNRFSFTLSITHTGQFAAAVCITTEEL